jgi:hypothetical protein
MHRRPALAAPVEETLRPPQVSSDVEQWECKDALRGTDLGHGTTRSIRSTSIQWRAVARPPIICPNGGVASR